MCIIPKWIHCDNYVANSGCQCHWLCNKLFHGGSIRGCFGSQPYYNACHYYYVCLYIFENQTSLLYNPPYWLVWLSFSITVGLSSVISFLIQIQILKGVNLPISKIIFNFSIKLHYWYWIDLNNNCTLLLDIKFKFGKHLETDS